MTKRGLIYTSLITAGITALVSCVSDEPSGEIMPEDGAVTLIVGIDRMDSNLDVETRVKQAEGEDQWSNVRFNSIKDTIGFFSQKGNLSDGTDNPILNEPMVFVRDEGSSTTPDRLWRGVFEAVNHIYDIGIIQSTDNKTFFYFPYCEDIEGKGLWLRKEVKGDDGSVSYRVIDALSINGTGSNTEAVLKGNFSHSFCELMILRGFGFDNPPEGQERITVVTSKPYSHVRVVDNPYTTYTNWKILEPYFDETTTWSSAPGELTPEQACKRFDTWHGAPYYVSDLSDPMETNYVIIPTAMSSSRSTVDYIEICDNAGEWHKVTGFTLLNENDKRAQPGWRIPLTVQMEGLVPTIYPFTISEWDEPENITDMRSSGINDPAGFLDFLSAYNQYNSQNRLEGGEAELKLQEYGDKYNNEGVITWHFYLNRDIDVRNIQVSGEMSYRLNELVDTIDGLNHTISNLDINNTSGFVGTLKDLGCLKNIQFSGLKVTNTTASTESATGGLVNEMTGGLITGCTVDGEVRAPGKVGMAVGTLSGGSIKLSTFTGLLIGSGRFNNMIGETTLPEGNWSGNNYSGIIFTSFE